LSTLAEIEDAVTGLPIQEQRSLLAWLEMQLRSAGDGPSQADSDRVLWLRELTELRRQMTTGRRGAELQEILDDLRGDR
jgi:hypothetical protein